MNPSQDPASSGFPPSTPPPSAGDGAYDETPSDGYGAPLHGYGDPLGGPATGAGGWQPWTADLRPVRRPWRRTVVVCLATLLAIAAVGAPLGLLWSWISPSVPVVQTTQSGIVVNDPSPEQFIAADGWFAILGFGFGVLAALAAWLLLGRHRGPWLLLGIVLGALGAAPLAWQVGRQLGLSGYEQWRDTAAAGDAFGRPPDLHAHGALLVPAFAAVIVCTLLAGWSNDPDLEAPGHRPGYGNDLAHADQGAALDQLSWGSPDGRDPTVAPGPPAPGSAAPPHG